METIGKEQRVKEDILRSALKTGKTEGWDALNMRKLADMIGYTPPTIYEYFPEGKESILQELARRGYVQLRQQLRAVVKEPEQMWLTYWNFAYSEKALYQLMFGVNMACRGAAESELVYGLFSNLYTEEAYYACWSAVHGLISINMISHGLPEMMNQHILKTIHQSIKQTTP